MSELQRWNEPLSESERESLIGRATEQIVRRGLSVPAILVLEMHKPVAFVISQGMIALAPLFAPIVGLENMQKLGRLLAEPGGVETLIRRIEDATPTPAKGKAS